MTHVEILAMVTAAADALINEETEGLADGSYELGYVDGAGDVIARVARTLLEQEASHVDS